MGFGDVLPVIIVVAAWILIGLVVVMFFGRSLRAPTESEIEAQHEHDEAAEEKTPAATH